MLSSKILPDNRDHTHRRKVARSQRKMRRRSAQTVINLAMRGFNAIERYRTYNENGHKLLFCDIKI
jgi:hypothetical protein